MISLFTDISSEMIVPVLPLFMTNVLGVAATSIGIIEGIAESTASILKVFSGWISDRAGKRKPMMVLGYGVANLVKPFFAVTQSWQQVLAIRFTDRFGKGIRGAPRDALLADSVPQADRGRAFGIQRALDAAGAALGPLVAAFILYTSHNNYRSVFWWSVLPGLAAIIAVVFFLKEEGSGRPKGVPAPRMDIKSFGRRYMLFSIGATIFALGNSSDAFLILRAQNLGMAVALVPLAYFLFKLVATLTSVPLGALSDRIGRRPVLVAGYLVFGLIYLGFALAQSSLHVWLLFAVYGLYLAATDGVQKAYVCDMVPATGRATAIGTINALTGIATLPASVAAGWLWQNVGPAAPFYFGSVIAFVTALWLAVFRL
jgi:MFS family permease